MRRTKRWLKRLMKIRMIRITVRTCLSTLNACALRRQNETKLKIRNMMGQFIQQNSNQATKNWEEKSKWTKKVILTKNWTLGNQIKFYRMHKLIKWWRMIIAMLKISVVMLQVQIGHLTFHAYPRNHQFQENQEKLQDQYKNSTKQ